MKLFSSDIFQLPQSWWSSPDGVWGGVIRGSFLSVKQWTIKITTAERICRKIVFSFSWKMVSERKRGVNMEVQRLSYFIRRGTMKEVQSPLTLYYVLHDIIKLFHSSFWTSPFRYTIQIPGNVNVMYISTFLKTLFEKRKILHSPKVGVKNGIIDLGRFP